MHKHSVLIIVLLLCTRVAVAQTDNWKSNAEGTIEYNCDAVNNVLTAVNAGDFETVTDAGGTLIIRFDNGTELTVNQYVGNTALSTWSEDLDADITLDDIFSAAQATCNSTPPTETVSEDNSDTFTVKAKGNINLRSCPGTNCDIVGTAQDGTLLTVLGTEDDWYRVQHGADTAYAASWLTIRGPDDIIMTDQPYFDAKTACIVVFDRKRGDMDMNIILSGDMKDEVLVDLYRPNETQPLRVEGQLDKTFIDTGETYIHQYYRWNVGWPQGLYQIEINMGDKTSKLAWELGERGDYNIFVMCN